MKLSRKLFLTTYHFPALDWHIFIVTYNYIFAYFDNVIIMTSTFEERLKSAGLTLIPEKSDVCKPELWCLNIC